MIAPMRGQPLSIWADGPWLQMQPDRWKGRIHLYLPLTGKESRPEGITGMIEQATLAWQEIPQHRSPRCFNLKA
jgi:hypothetical protein